MQTKFKVHILDKNSIEFDICIFIGVINKNTQTQMAVEGLDIIHETVKYSTNLSHSSVIILIGVSIILQLPCIC